MRRTVSLLLLAVLASPALAQEGVFLSRDSRPGGEEVLLVQGADPHRPVEFVLFEGLPEDGDVLWEEYPEADATGRAWLPIPGAVLDEYLRQTEAGLLSVRARAFQAGALVESNPVVLREPAAIYVLVEERGGGSQILRVDPAGDRSLSLVRDGASSMALAGTRGSLFYASAEPALVRLGAHRGRPQGNAALPRNERVLDLCPSGDGSLLLALTARADAGDQALRLRRLDVERLAWSGGRDVLRSSGSPAWLVAGADSRRVFVAERRGLVQEYFLGPRLQPGLVVFSAEDPRREELLAARVCDDRLVAVTRPVLADRADRAGRLIVVDLHTRETVREVALQHRPRDLEVVVVAGMTQVVVLEEAGCVEVFPPDAVPALAVGGVLRVPGGRELAGDSRDGAVYVLADPSGRGRGTRVIRLELEQRGTWSQVPGLEGSPSARGLGLCEAGDRRWLFLLDGTPEADGDILRLWPLDAATDAVREFPLPGRVRQIQTR